ncbi:MAG: chalcone isomerase family protein [Casimicrobiaceae bacterium]
MNEETAMRTTMVAAVATFLLAGTAAAAEVGGVKLDDRMSVGGQELMLNGAGIRTRAIFKVYVASLYLPAKAGTVDAILAKGPRRIQLNLLRDLSGDQLADAVNDGLNEANTAAEVDAIKAQTAEFIALCKSMGPLKEGSVITLDFVDNATKVGFNGAAKGSIAGEAFNRALTKVWIGDKPVQADLRKAMLGG